MKKQISELKAAIAKNGGAGLPEQATTDGFNAEKGREIILEHISADKNGGNAFAELDAYRKGTHADCLKKDKTTTGGGYAIDMTLEQYVKKTYGFKDINAFYTALGIDPERSTLASFNSYGENSAYRFLVPEIFLEAVRLGLMMKTIYPQIIKGEQSVNTLNVNMPSVKQMNAIPKLTREGESITMGTINFGTRSVRCGKYTQGFNISDESIQYTSINLITEAIEQMTMLFGMGMDSLAIRTLIDGDQPDGSLSAPVVGVATANTVVWDDLDRVQMRMGMLANMPQTYIGNEIISRNVRALPEYRGYPADRVQQVLKTNLPLPQELQHLLTPFIPEGLLMFVNKNAGLLRLIAAGLRIETERNAGKQTNDIFISTTFGFANLKRDGRVILDKSQDDIAAPFPAYMDVTAYAAQFELEQP